MCKEWWTEARNADEKSVMQARGTMQRELVKEIPREHPWIESGSLVREFWSAVEYGGILEFLGRLKAQGHAPMAKLGQDILLQKKGKQHRSQFINKLNAIAVAIVVEIVLDMAAANECNR